MAMDTASRRASAINLSCPWRGIWPIPDGSIGQGDRLQTAFMYAGIPGDEVPDASSSVSAVSGIRPLLSACSGLRR